jgi:hypothetical protein
MDWRASIRDNWAFKIAALLIVSLLWINLTADERQAQEVLTLVEYEVLDSAWVLVDAPREVRTTFQGRNRELLGLLVNEPVIRIAVTEVTGPSMRYQLDPDLVDYDNDLQVRPSLVVPMTVELQLERMTERRVPVVADLETIPAMGYTVLRPLLVEPDSVTVRGAASQVARVGQVTTRRVTLDNLEHPVMRDLPLEPPAGIHDITLVPPSALVTVQVDSLVVRQTRLPVRAVGEGAAGVSVSPDSVDAEARGSWTWVRRQLDSMSHATVEVPEPLRSPAVMPLTVERAEGGFVSVLLRPAEVTVTPGQQ